MCFNPRLLSSEAFFNLRRLSTKDVFDSRVLDTSENDLFENGLHSSISKGTVRDLSMISDYH